MQYSTAAPVISNVTVIIEVEVSSLTSRKHKEFRKKTTIINNFGPWKSGSGFQGN